MRNMTPFYLAITLVLGSFRFCSSQAGFYGKIYTVVTMTFYSSKHKLLGGSCRQKSQVVWLVRKRLWCASYVLVCINYFRLSSAVAWFWRKLLQIWTFCKDLRWSNTRLWGAHQNSLLRTIIRKLTRCITYYWCDFINVFVCHKCMQKDKSICKGKIQCISSM